MFYPSRIFVWLSLAFVCVSCGDNYHSGFDEGSYEEVQDIIGPFSPIVIDILWVIENSHSMQEEQEALKRNIYLFFQALQDFTPDFHLAVITTDVMDPRHAGRFQNVPRAAPGASGEPAVDLSACPGPQNGQDYLPPILRSEAYALPNGDLDLDKLVLHFVCNASVGTQGRGVGAGLEAARLALDLNLRQTYNAPFLRDDAFLLLFFLSDKNDCSWPSGQADAREDADCEWYADQLVPVQEYVDFFTQLKQGDASKVVVGGIVAPDMGVRFAPSQPVAPSCVSERGAGYAGYRYEQFFEAFPSHTISDLCQPSFEEALLRLLPFESLGEISNEVCLSQTPAACASGAKPQGEGEARSDGSPSACSDLHVEVERFSPRPPEGRVCRRAEDGWYGCELEEGRDFVIDHSDTLCPSGVSVKLEEDVSRAYHAVWHIRYRVPSRRRR